jgi:two-component system sensor histidine kinase DegS
VQEGLTNIKKHAGARNIKLKLETGQEHINILITDDGRGFNVEEVMALHKTTSGFGLTSMKERVELIGGNLEIDSKPGKGTKLFVRVPQSG